MAMMSTVAFWPDQVTMNIFLNRNWKRVSLFIFLAAFLFLAAFFYASGKVFAAEAPRITSLKVMEYEQNVVSEGSITSGSAIKDDEPVYIIVWKTKGFSKKKKTIVKIFITNRKGTNSGDLLYEKELGRAGSALISLDDIQTNYYYFFIEVSQGKKSVRKLYDEMIYIEAPKAPARMTGVTANVVDDHLHIAWDDKEEGASHWAGIYSYKEGTYVSTAYSDGNYIDVRLPEDTERTVFSVAKFVDGVRGALDLRTIPDVTKPDAKVSFDTDATLTNNDIFPVDVTFNGDCKVNVSINGNAVIEDAAAVGRYNIPLEEGKNKVVFTVTADNGNIKHFERGVTLDTIPPELKINGDPNEGVTTAAQIELTGTSESGAKLSVNGKAVKTAEDGTFSFPVFLKKGSNVIEIAAEDAAGNVNYNAITVFRKYIPKNSMNKKAALLVGGFFGIIMLGYIICFVMWLSKRHIDKKANGK